MPDEIKFATFEMSLPPDATTEDKDRLLNAVHIAWFNSGKRAAEAKRPENESDAGESISDLRIKLDRASALAASHYERANEAIEERNALLAMLPRSTEADGSHKVLRVGDRVETNDGIAYVNRIAAAVIPERNRASLDDCHYRLGAKIEPK